MTVQERARSSFTFTDLHSIVQNQGFLKDVIYKSFKSKDLADGILDLVNRIIEENYLNELTVRDLFCILKATPRSNKRWLNKEIAYIIQQTVA